MEASFRDEVSTIVRSGFTDAEISAAKASWLQAQQLNRDQNAGLAGRLAGLMHNGRTMAWEAELQKKVEALTSQQIVVALQRHVDVSAMTIVKAGDFKRVAAKP